MELCAFASGSTSVRRIYTCSSDITWTWDRSIMALWVLLRLTPGAWLLCSLALTRVWASCGHSVQLPRLALWGSPIGHPHWSMFDLGLPSPASAAWAFPRAHRRPSCAPGFVHRVAIESSSLWSSQPLRGGSLSAVTPTAPVSAFVDSGLQSGVSAPPSVSGRHRLAGAVPLWLRFGPGPWSQSSFQPLDSLCPHAGCSLDFSVSDPVAHLGFLG